MLGQNKTAEHLVSKLTKPEEEEDQEADDEERGGERGGLGSGNRSNDKGIVGRGEGGRCWLPCFWLN